MRISDHQHAAVESEVGIERDKSQLQHWDSTRGHRYEISGNEHGRNEQFFVLSGLPHLALSHTPTRAPGGVLKTRTRQWAQPDSRQAASIHDGDEPSPTETTSPTPGPSTVLLTLKCLVLSQRHAVSCTCTTEAAAPSSCLGGRTRAGKRHVDLCAEFSRRQLFPSRYARLCSSLSRPM